MWISGSDSLCELFLGKIRKSTLLSQVLSCELKVKKQNEIVWKTSFANSRFISFSQPAEASNTELAKQREIEKEKEDLMDEGDFLEYKVSGF